MTSQSTSATAPRYLTGDQPGLREFLDKFDVGFPPPPAETLWSRD